MGGDQYEGIDLTVFESKFFTIDKLPRRQEHRTDFFEVYSHRGNRLAVIRWYGPWRQYVFFPDRETIWTVGCLSEIQIFINGLMNERKGKKKVVS